MLIIILCLMTVQVEWDFNSDTLCMLEDEPLFSQDHKLFSQRLRFNLDWSIGHNWSLEMAYDQAYMYRKRHLWIPASTHLRSIDMSSTISHNENMIWLHQIDRLALHKRWKSVELIIGRQAVGFGNGRFFNPSDIFSPITPYSLNTEYKAGIDGIRLIWSVNEDTGLEVTSYFTEVDGPLSVFKVFSHLMGIDVSGYIGDAYGELTLGWDFAWTGDTSVWYTEGLLRDGINRKDPLRVMAGVQRRIRDKFDMLIEYQYHSQGLTDFSSLPVQFTEEYLYGELFYLGKQQAALLLQIEHHPLFHSTVQLIHDFSGSSQWILLSFDWDRSERTNLRFGFLGSHGDTISEFGWYTNTAFCEFKLVL